MACQPLGALAAELRDAGLDHAAELLTKADDLLTDAHASIDDVYIAEKAKKPYERLG